jgi:hypothetical protein
LDRHHLPPLSRLLPNFENRLRHRQQYREFQKKKMWLLRLRNLFLQVPLVKKQLFR